MTCPEHCNHDCAPGMLTKDLLGIADGPHDPDPFRRWLSWTPPTNREIISPRRKERWWRSSFKTLAGE